MSDREVKRLTPNSIANLVMADEAWHDSLYVKAEDYDSLLADFEALRTALAAEQPKPSSNFDNQGAVLLLRSKSAEIERLKADSEALRRENKRLRTASEKLFRKWSNAAPYHQWEPEMFEMEFALYPPNEGDKR